MLACSCRTLSRRCSVRGRGVSIWEVYAHIACQIFVTSSAEEVVITSASITSLFSSLDAVLSRRFAQRTIAQTDSSLGEKASVDGQSLESIGKRLQRTAFAL